MKTELGRVFWKTFGTEIYAGLTLNNNENSTAEEKESYRQYTEYIEFRKQKRRLINYTRNASPQTILHIDKNNASLVSFQNWIMNNNPEIPMDLRKEIALEVLSQRDPSYKLKEDIAENKEYNQSILDKRNNQTRPAIEKAHFATSTTSKHRILEE
jgi:hypothetical protein